MKMRKQYESLKEKEKTMISMSGLAFPDKYFLACSCQSAEKFREILFGKEFHEDTKKSISEANRPRALCH